MLAAEIEHLRNELDTMAERGPLPHELETLRKDLRAAPPAPKNA